MSGVPHLMQALVAEENAQPLRLMQVFTPRPSAGQVLVRVAASGVNPLDAKILAGAAEHARQPLPAILGMDVAGVVVALGAGVTEFRVDYAVFGMAGGVGGHAGSLAEYMTAGSRLLAPKPGNLTMREAAVLPLVFITAWEGLVDRAGVHAGQQVLVQGGAGGRGFDIVFDTAGAFAMVRRFGHVVSALGWGVHALAPLSFRAASYSGVFTLLPLLTGEGREHHGAILREAVRLVEAGDLTPLLGPRRFTFETANDAYRAIESGCARGKLAIDISEEAGT